MNVQDHSTADLMRQRVELVGEVSALTARGLKLAQAASGIEMDTLRLELEIGRNPADARLVQELHDTEERAAAARAAQAACGEEIAAAERIVAALDELIAAARGA